jgi:recombinational DNA repair ATPase RecF
MSLGPPRIDRIACRTYICENFSGAGIPPVTLLSIELSRFRNFPGLGLSLDARGAVLEAPNGQGKTNFLEAVHYLNLFRSFRAAPDSELVRFGESGFRVRGEVEKADGRRRAVAAALEGTRKRVLIDGRPSRPAEHIGSVLSVILSPGDIRLVQGSPAGRRRYLDVILALSSRRYLRALQEYRRVLQQRNRVLQTGRAALQPALLEPWTEGLVRHGGVILEERRRFLDRWAARLGEISARIAGSSDGALGWRYESTVEIPPAGPEESDPEDLEPAGARSPTAAVVAVLGSAAGGAYMPPEGAGQRADARGSLRPPDVPRAPRPESVDAGSADGRFGDLSSERDGGFRAGAADRASAAAESALRVELERRAPLERRRGLTLAGPHRDDFSIRAPGGAGVDRDLRRYGSQGEQRTAALALRFLESEVLGRERGELPIVLLDDVFSELDPQRSRELLGFLAPAQQVFLTTPRPLASDLDLDLPRYRVVSGSLHPA